MHVHIAWQIYHHQQKVKVSPACPVLGGGGLWVCDLPIEEALKQSEDPQPGRIRSLGKAIQKSYY